MEEVRAELPSFAKIAHFFEDIVNPEAAVKLKA